MKPIGQGFIAGLQFVDKNENAMVVTASEDSDFPKAVIDGLPADFYGGGAWQAPLTNDMGVRLTGSIYVQVNLEKPINFAAYSMDMMSIRIEEQAKEIGVEVSTDGGKTFKSLGRQTFDMSISDVVDWVNYVYPFANKVQIAELYVPIRNVNAIRFVVYSAFSSPSAYSIEELKIYEKK